MNYRNVKIILLIGILITWLYYLIWIYAWSLDFNYAWKLFIRDVNMMPIYDIFLRIIRIIYKIISIIINDMFIKPIKEIFSIFFKIVSDPINLWKGDQDNEHSNIKENKLNKK